jgi:hypothetical protein
MEAYVGVDVQIHSFLTSALVGGEWSASHAPTALPPVPIRQKVGWTPQSRSGREEEKILDLTGTRNSEPSVVQHIASRYTDYAIQVPFKICIKVILQSMSMYFK